MVSSEVVVRDGPNRRLSPRMPASLSAALRGPMGAARRSPCRIIDISAGGARLRLYEILAPETSIQLALPGRMVDARIVWADGREAGCRFDPPIDQATLDLVRAKRDAA